MDTIVREIHGEEMLEIMHRLPGYGLHPTPPLPDKEEHKEIFKKRKGAIFYAMFEGKEPVACAASSAMTQNIRGEMYAMGGIWGVATNPSVRRKGYQRRVLGELFDAIREMGQPFSCLYPFRGSFYERLGYVTFPVPRKAIFEPSVLQPLIEIDLNGDIELQLLSDGYDIYRDYLYRIQKRIHGLALFDSGDKDSVLRNDQWLVLAKVDGKLEGVMVYGIKGEFPTKFTMRVTRFYYDTSWAKYKLLAWISRHIDQANTVEIWLPPFEYPEVWLSDLRISMEPVFFAPMGRVISMADIGGMKIGEGSFSTRIVDQLCPWNDAVWDFETVDGSLYVNPGEDPECTLNIQGLTALIYGTHDPGDFTFLGWGDPGPETRQTMRSMFSREIPYLHRIF